MVLHFAFCILWIYLLFGILHGRHFRFFILSFYILSWRTFDYSEIYFSLSRLTTTYSNCFLVIDRPDHVIFCGNTAAVENWKIVKNAVWSSISRFLLRRGGKRVIFNLVATILTVMIYGFQLTKVLPNGQSCFNAKSSSSIISFSLVYRQDESEKLSI